MLFRVWQTNIKKTNLLHVLGGEAAFATSEPRLHVYKVAEAQI